MLNWLYTAISWVLLRWHDLFSLFLPHGSGATWALSIVFLVITIRVLLFPLFVKQFHSMRAMQELQPKMQALRKKYADDRQRQTQELMALQREAGANPLGGCLPLLAQAPVFLSLYHVLRHLRVGNNATLYGWTKGQFDSAVGAKFLGAPIPATFRTASEFAGANVTTTRVVIIVLLMVSCVATYITQWQNFQRNKANLEGQQATIQKVMMYLVPVGLLFSGIVFGLPLGVLFYWLANNLWTMGQQFYMLGHLTNKVEARKAETADPAAAVARPLAPRPGAKPVRDRRGRPVPADGAATTLQDDIPADSVDPMDTAGPSTVRDESPDASKAAQTGRPPARQPDRVPGGGKGTPPAGRTARQPARAGASRPPPSRPNRKKKRR